MDDVSVAEVEEGEGAASGAGVDRLPEAVEHQDGLLKRLIHERVRW